MNDHHRHDFFASYLSSHLVVAYATCLLVIQLGYILIWSPNFNATVPGGDYLQFYVAARIVRDAKADRLYDFPYQIQSQRDASRMPFEPVYSIVALYIYPPFFVWFCLPFSYLAFRVCASAWVLFMSGCLIAALRLLVSTTTKTRVDMGFAVLASVPFLPSLMSIYSCQNSTLSLLILATTFVLLREGRPMTAGAVFALQAFKPQLTPVIAFAMLCKKQWRFVVGGLGEVLYCSSPRLPSAQPPRWITSVSVRLSRDGSTCRECPWTVWPVGMGSGDCFSSTNRSSTPRRRRRLRHY